MFGNVVNLQCIGVLAQLQQLRAFLYEYEHTDSLNKRQVKEMENIRQKIKHIQDMCQAVCMSGHHRLGAGSILSPLYHHGLLEDMMLKQCDWLK